MPDRSRPRFGTTELDPNLLSSSFGASTNWHVITGAPSCGKTTLIDLLTDGGFRTVPEGARRHIEEEIARGRTIGEIHRDGAGLQRRIAAVQLSIEGGLDPLDVAFLDGAVPSSLAWYRVFGLDPNEVLGACFRRRYSSVFVLDRLPYRRDGMRFDDDGHAGFLDEWIPRDYRALGYEVVRVPVQAPVERLAFVLARLSMQRPD